MIIDSIKLSGWRSYDSSGITLNNLKSINLIIGPNNSGKSNLSKYFNYLKNISDGKLARNGLTTFDAILEEGQTWSWQKNDIFCDIILSKDNNLESLEKSSYKLSAHEIGLHCHHKAEGKSASLNYSVDGKQIFDGQGQIFSSLVSDKPIDASDNVPGFFDNSIYWSKFLDSLVFVDPIRHHSRNSDNTKSFYFDGAKIIDELDRLRTDDANKSKWLIYKEKIKSWLSDILSENVTSIDVSNSDLRLEFNSNLLFSLDELGTGVSQIVMLLSHLWLNKDSNLNVFLEEPEANLHPDSVVNLVRIFENELINHKFFITTHSPSLIDCLNDKWTVFRAIKNGNGSSDIVPSDNVIKHYETLDALGVKASQILQANTVIWVEGPSDRIYIKRWIDVFSNNELEEGKDYSFLFFGGTNLASFTALDDEDEIFVNMLSTSRKAYLITDSDCSSQTDKDSLKYKSTLLSLLERVRTVEGEHKGIDTELEDYFKIWISEGREIENYIGKELLFDVLTMKGFKREYIGTGKHKKDLEVISSQEFEFEKFDSFDEAISNSYKFKESQTIDKVTQENIALSYAGKKVQIAREVAKKWDRKHAVYYELEANMEELVAFIRK